MEQLTLYHNNPDLKTLKDFMDANNITGISVDELFDFRYNEEKSNRDLFFEQMTASEKAEYSAQIGKSPLSASDLKSDMTLPCPCIFKIKAEYVTRDIAIAQTNFQENVDDVYAFANSMIQNILNNPGYYSINSSRKESPRCSVWGWFKSLNYGGITSNGTYITQTYTGQENGNFTNISDFILNVSTNVSAQGGSFSITLPIIRAIPQQQTEVYYDKEDEVAGGNILDYPSYSEYNRKFASPTQMLSYDSYKNGDVKNFYHKVGLSSMEKNYFNWLIQSNDLIFIAFEELEMEKVNGSRIFDMIGLVESVTVSTDSNGTGRVTVNGKDLMKLITDDNSLFFNQSTCWGKSRIFLNTESLGKQGDIRDADIVGSMQSGPENRLRWTGNQLDVFAKPFNRTISFVLKGVISQLANIEVVPDYIFTSWGDSRTRYQDWLSYEEQEIDTILSDDEYGDTESYISTGIEFNENVDDYVPFDRYVDFSKKSELDQNLIMHYDYKDTGGETLQVIRNRHIVDDVFSKR